MKESQYWRIELFYVSSSVKSIIKKQIDYNRHTSAMLCMCWMSQASFFCCLPAVVECFESSTTWLTVSWFPLALQGWSGFKKSKKSAVSQYFCSPAASAAPEGDEVVGGWSFFPVRDLLRAAIIKLRDTLSHEEKRNEYSRGTNSD